MKKYYIVDDCWNLIKLFMYHSIKKHGKHLKKNDKNVCLYNEVVKSIPTIQQPRTGPKIIYNSAGKKIRVAKFLYHGKQLKKCRPSARPVPLYNTIIEYISIVKFKPKGFTLYGKDLTTRNNISWYYYENLKNVKSKLV
tara:strand:- start:1957 stop:2373 length:417 start_codon:yes stop_codon:yes gene_type:complete